MAWQAEVTSKTQGVGYVEFGLRYVDPATTRERNDSTRVLDGNIDGLKRYVQTQLARLTASDSLEGQVALGAFDPTITVTPDPDEVAYQTWARNFARLRRVQELITLGVLTGTEPGVTNLRNAVRDNFQASYLNRLG